MAKWYNQTDVPIFFLHRSSLLENLPVCCGQLHGDGI